MESPSDVVDSKPPNVKRGVAVPKDASRRMSTNQKLQEFLNKTEIIDEEADALDVEEMKAKQRVRTASLYGAGARFKFPKTKKKVLPPGLSPFMLEKPETEKIENIESSSVPPGAHEDQFRRLRYPTEKSMSDPDRVFYTTTSMTDGIRVMDQPPWYFGYQNKTKPSDTSIVTTVARYGYKGSKEINQYHTRPTSPSSLTMTEHTPKFLAPQDYINEWVPPIEAKPLNQGYLLTSPKLWPENATYVNGYKEKTRPTSMFYNRETTIQTIERPQTSPYLDTTYNRTLSEFELLRNCSKKESLNMVESRPKTQQTNFRRKWNDTLMETASSTLRQTLRQGVPAYEEHTLSDPSDKMRYSGSTALIIHSSSTEEVKFKMRMETSATSIPFDLRWRQVINMYKTLRSRLTREQTSDEAIHIYAEKLRSAALKHGQKAALLRTQFIAAMSSTFFFEHLPDKQISLLFSVFDPLKKSFVIFADIICAMTLLDQPTKYESVLDLLVTLWRIYDTYGDDQQPILVAENVLCSVCGSDREYTDMKQMIKRSIRPTLYAMAARHTDSEDDKLVTKTANQTIEIKKNKKKHLIVQPVYNIYDGVFDEKMFRNVLSKCPEVVELYNRQLTARFIQCYGKDPREIIEEDVVSPNCDKDYSWILKKKK